jgi:LacI family transcriptional regulator
MLAIRTIRTMRIFPWCFAHPDLDHQGAMRYNSPIMSAIRHIGLLLDIQEEYPRSIVEGIIRYGRASGRWQIMTKRCRPVLLWDDLDHWKGDGIIAWVRYPAEIKRLQRLRGPVVNVSSWLARMPFPSVLSDNRAIGAMAAEHLLDRGIKRFAFLRVLDTAYARDRESAFAATVRSAGFDCVSLYPRSAFPEMEGEHPADPDGAELAEILHSLERPVGLLAVTDFLGRHIVATCQENGIHVPDELAVVGVDNETLFCAMAEPQLSSVALAGEQMGFQAASLLDDLIDGKRAQSRTMLIPPTGIVARHSTDVLAIDDPKVGAAVRFIRDNAARCFDVSDILRNVPVSRRSLEIRFRKIVGRSMHEEIRRVHIRRAKSLLVSTNLTVPDVAESSGYNGPDRFRVAFVKEAGMTPTAYRQQFTRR